MGNFRWQVGGCGCDCNQTCEKCVPLANGVSFEEANETLDNWFLRNRETVGVSYLTADFIDATDAATVAYVDSSFAEETKAEADALGTNDGVFNSVVIATHNTGNYSYKQLPWVENLLKKYELYSPLSTSILRPKNWSSLPPSTAVGQIPTDYGTPGAEYFLGACGGPYAQLKRDGARFGEDPIDYHTGRLAKSADDEFSLTFTGTAALPNVDAYSGYPTQWPGALVFEFDALLRKKHRFPTFKLTDVPILGEAGSKPGACSYEIAKTKTCLSSLSNWTSVNAYNKSYKFNIANAFLTRNGCVSYCPGGVQWAGAASFGLGGAAKFMAPNFYLFSESEFDAYLETVKSGGSHYYNNGVFKIYDVRWDSESFVPTAADGLATLSPQVATVEAKVKGIIPIFSSVATPSISESALAQLKEILSSGYVEGDAATSLTQDPATKEYYCGGFYWRFNAATINQYNVKDNGE